MKEGKLNLLDIQNRKGASEKIILLTSYDFPIANIADQSGADIILVSDALGMIALGYETTVPVTLDEIIHHTKAVTRAVKRSLVIATMPFMSFSCSIGETLHNCGRILKETGANGVEIEGDDEIVEVVKSVTHVGIPVLAHIGLTRRYYMRFGRFKAQGRDSNEAMKLVNLARSLELAGAFAVILECVTDRLAKIITDRLRIPTIGIGSGPYCDGQAIVTQDLLGVYEEFKPKFVKRYANLSEDIRRALADFKNDVNAGGFPGREHTFTINDIEYEKLVTLMENENDLQRDTTI
jgi:3-methyl-2-oxobutanoate hydroxymethyltransferase